MFAAAARGTGRCHRIIHNGKKFSTALVRHPSPLLSEGLVTHIQRSHDVSVSKATTQWRNYVALLEEKGWDVFHAPPLDDAPDGVFIEDNMLVCAEGANSTIIIMNSSSPERRSEVIGLEEEFLFAVHDNITRVADIDESAYIDGGDVLKVGKTMYIGESSRTNRRGIEAVKTILQYNNIALDIVTVPTNKVLHLKSGISALPNGVLIGHLDNVDDEMLNVLQHKFVPVPEIEGTAVVDLGGGNLLASSSAPETKRMIEGEYGFTVNDVDISEFEKLEGCVTCLSVRIR